jgi:hypothetical protein
MLMYMLGMVLTVRSGATRLCEFSSYDANPCWLDVEAADRAECTVKVNSGSTTYTVMVYQRKLHVGKEVYPVAMLRSIVNPDVGNIYSYTTVLGEWPIPAGFVTNTTADLYYMDMGAGNRQGEQSSRFLNWRATVESPLVNLCVSDTGPEHCCIVSESGGSCSLPPTPQGYFGDRVFRQYVNTVELVRGGDFGCEWGATHYRVGASGDGREDVSVTACLIANRNNSNVLYQYVEASHENAFTKDEPGFSASFDVACQ